MCPQYTQPPESSAQIDFETFQAIVNQIPNRKGFTFEMSSYGETLVTSHWQQMLAYVVGRKPKANVNLVTNGVILNEDITNKILATPPHTLQVSIDAASAESAGPSMANNCASRYSILNSPRAPSDAWY